MSIMDDFLYHKKSKITVEIRGCFQRFNTFFVIFYKTLSQYGVLADS